MNHRTYEMECQREGHAPPLVEHLRGWHTKLTCPRCGKAVIEHGLADHPLAKQAANELSTPARGGNQNIASAT